MDRLTIGIDVGGTSIRAAVVDGTGSVVDTVRSPTPHSGRALEDALDRTVARLAGRNEVTAVGLAVAGFLTADRRVVRFAPHLPWADVPVAERMSARIGLPVILEHDANAAAWAEYRFGAAAGVRTTVLVAVGTGIGAALLLDGVPFRGAHGIAPNSGTCRWFPTGGPARAGSGAAGSGTAAAPRWSTRRSNCSRQTRTGPPRSPVTSRRIPGR